MTNFMLSKTPLNTDEIAPSLLNIDIKERSNLLAWNGQFSPQFVETVLKHYATAQTRIYDPFCGSGTVLYEAGRLGLPAMGIELNPAAFILARTYVAMNLRRDERNEVIDNVDTTLSKIGCDAGILTDHDDEIDIGSELVKVVQPLTGFSKALAESLIILSDFHKGSTRGRIRRTWWKLRKIVETLPYSRAQVDVKLGDCRAVGNPRELFDFVLTSPPYINVYNYHQQYRRSTEALGWDLLEVAKAEIGSNRKHRGNRFLTVIQYCLDMAQVLCALDKMTSETARFVFVVGRESNVRGIPFYNGELFAEVAISALGFELITRQERAFGNRFGQKIYEDIIHIQKRDIPRDVPLETVRAIAGEALRASLKRKMKSEIKSDLVDAIRKIDEINPSQIYNHTEQ